MHGPSPQLLISALIATTSLAAPLAAEGSAFTPSPRAPASAQAAPAARSSTEIARFAPSSERREHRIDYAHWDEALGWFVIPMGPSIREGAPRVDPETGTRRIYGHQSRYRLEGNLIAFSFLTPEIRQALSDYRADLEQVGSTLDLTHLPRNEQLAFWLNLHNVAMIEALAREYPVSQAADLGLDDRKLVTIAGVALSPRDIRERIVYPNWRDPKVMYGFWRGVVGGPSIQRLAFTGDNVDTLLALSAEEFVNSLRGVERWGGSLRLSPIFAEAAPFYFADDEALRAHLVRFATEDVRQIVTATRAVDYKPLEGDVADFAGGDTTSRLYELSVQDCRGSPCRDGVSTGTASPTRFPPSVQRMLAERTEKLERARRAGIRTGMVIYGNGEYSPDAPAVEVE
jgi:hypothetical protein